MKLGLGGTLIQRCAAIVKLNSVRTLDSVKLSCDRHKVHSVYKMQSQLEFELNPVTSLLAKTLHQRHA